MDKWGAHWQRSNETTLSVSSFLDCYVKQSSASYGSWSHVHPPALTLPFAKDIGLLGNGDQIGVLICWSTIHSGRQSMWPDQVPGYHTRCHVILSSISVNCSWYAIVFWPNSQVQQHIYLVSCTLWMRQIPETMSSWCAHQHIITSTLGLDLPGQKHVKMQGKNAVMKGTNFNAHTSKVHVSQ